MAPRSPLPHLVAIIVIDVHRSVVVHSGDSSREIVVPSAEKPFDGGAHDQGNGWPASPGTSVGAAQYLI